MVLLEELVGLNGWRSRNAARRAPTNCGRQVGRYPRRRTESPKQGATAAPSGVVRHQLEAQVKVEVQVWARVRAEAEAEAEAEVERAVPTRAYQRHKQTNFALWYK